MELNEEKAFEERKRLRLAARRQRAADRAAEQDFEFSREDF